MKMHYCTCRINLAGQGFHIIEIYPQEPMSWPEVQLIMAIHHEENVYDIKPIAIADTDQVAEKRRLQSKYRSAGPLVEQVFPGRNPTNMQMLMPGETENQPPADEYGVPQRTFDDDDDAPPGGLGLEPPNGVAVMKPSTHSPPRREL